MNEDLVDQYRMLHASNPKYGNGAYFHLHLYELITKYNLQKILDFGCGKGNLSKVLEPKLDKLNGKQIGNRNHFQIINYDPAIPEHSQAPKPTDLVIANDVFEHFDPTQFEDDLQYVQWLAGSAVFASISCRPAVHHLPNGENCHSTLMRQEDWLDAMDKAFFDKQRIETQYNEKNESLRVFYLSKKLLVA